MADEIRYDWDDGNVRHIARHRVTREEAEQVIENDPLELKPQIIGGEERFPNIGVTDAGRWLVVVLTERGTKARVVTAFDAGKELIACYIRERWGNQ